MNVKTLTDAGLTRREARLLEEWFDPWTWALDVANITLPKGGKIELHDRPFLRDIFRDMYKEIVVIKGAQLGVSTTAMVRTFWFLTTFPSTAIYTFPTGSDVSRFTQARINPLVQGSPYLADRIVNVNSVKVKQFGLMPTRRGRFNRPIHEGPRSTLYFSGSTNEKDATTVDADLLIHDEEDLSSPQIIEQFSSRLAASKFGWKFRLSTPRIPGAGIDRVFQTTDGRKWLIRCPLCNHDQELAFPGGPWDYSNVEPDPNDWGEVQWNNWDADGRPARFVCARCGKPLEDDDRLNGRWVITRPEREVHGYQVSQLAAPWISASQVLQSFRKATWASDFWNLVMGIAWQEGSSVMGEEGILARCSGFPMAVSAVGTTAGIDVGAKFDVVVGKTHNGVPTTIWMGRLDSYDELDKVMNDFGVVTAVIDAAPEEHATRAWADKYNRYPKPGSKLPAKVRVWRAVYGGGSKGSGQQVRWNDQTGVVQAPRTEILSLSAEELLHERVLPKYDGSSAWRAYIAHHVASKKVPRFVEGLEADGVVERYEWHEVGPDHMFHAGTYEMMARMAPQALIMPKIALITTHRGKALEPAPDSWKKLHYRGG